MCIRDRFRNFRVWCAELPSGDCGTPEGQDCGTSESGFRSSRALERRAPEFRLRNSRARIAEPPG
eukprot:6383743-Alexandrium_andersonii.AAC.1